MIKILLILNLTNSMMFYQSKTPLTMGMILLIQSLIISLMSGMLSMNFWYSYILYLIMVGSMLILFIYMCSLISNQKFIFNKNYKLLTMNSLLIIFILYSLLFNLKFYPNFNSDSINIMSMMDKEQIFMLKMSMNKLYNNPTNQIMFMMINYLLMNLFIVVKITNINMGPLRKNI